MKSRGDKKRKNEGTIKRSTENSYSPTKVRTVASCLTMSAQKKKRKVEFGSNHPDIHRDLGRVRSSPDEMKYVARCDTLRIYFYLVNHFYAIPVS